MRRIRQDEIEAMQDEVIRRMGEPEPYRTLRLQKERIEHNRRIAREREGYDRQAEQLRREIEAMGETPEA